MQEIIAKEYKRRDKLSLMDNERPLILMDKDMQYFLQDKEIKKLLDKRSEIENKLIEYAMQKTIDDMKPLNEGVYEALEDLPVKNDGDVRFNRLIDTYV